MALVIPSRSYSFNVAATNVEYTFYSAQFAMSGLNSVYGTVISNFLNGLAIGSMGTPIWRARVETSNDGMTWSVVNMSAENLGTSSGESKPYQTLDIVGGVFARIQFTIRTGTSGSMAGLLEITFDANTGIA